MRPFRTCLALLFAACATPLFATPLFASPHAAAPANRAPLITGLATVHVQAGVASPLSAFVFDDADAGDGPLTLTFEVDAGTLTLADVPGVAIAGSGTGTAAVTGAHDTLLAYVRAGNVQFTSAPDGPDDVALLVTIDDNGHSGRGGARSAEMAAMIQVAAAAARGNSPPSGSPRTFTTPVDTPVAVTLDATDPDGDPLTFTIQRFPAAGTLTGTPPALTYTPAAGFHGSDSLTYTASDGIAESDTIHIALVVRRPFPVPYPQSVTTTADVPLAITLLASNPRFFQVYDPVHGTVAPTVTASTVTYTPPPGFEGSDSFEFEAFDGGYMSPRRTSTSRSDPARTARRWPRR